MKIKGLIIATLMTAFISVGSSFAQTNVNFGINCDGNNSSPIKCGYFTEGYQDGANDARTKRDHDYKRYRNKYENQYENSYKEGYERGYSSIIPFSRWNDKQKDIYRQGYNDGDDDKDKRISRLPRRYEGQYDREFDAYYRKGYFDGYDQRPRQYDVPLDDVVNPINPNVIGFPTRAPNRVDSSTGSLIWEGRIDQRANIILQGGTARVQTLAGQNLGQGVRNLNGQLPQRQATVMVNKLDGRGVVSVIQQPTRVNRYTTIVQINDRGRGADNYRLQISWQSTNAFENYSRGSLKWKGRVDQTVTLRISGEDAEAFTISGRNVVEISNNLDGYLARRRGTVSVRKLNGRGTVSILEHPSPQNNYNAVIQIFDPKSSDDEYEIEVSW